MASAASGADQLKEEKLRYIAAAELEAAQVENADYWDLSSEDECLSAQSQPRFPDSSTSQAVASGAGRTMSEAEPLAGMDKHHILSCHSGLPQHAILVARVKQMLQQHEMGSLSSTDEMQQQLLALFPAAKGSVEACAAQDYLQQVIANLHGKPKLQERPDSPDLADSPEFHNHAHQTSATAAAHVHKCQDTAGQAMNDVAVHMFPVEKQMLLQMRLRQMHGRQPADLITTPAKQMPVRSLGAGMVSSSHVGPPQLSSLPLHARVSQPEMQLPAAALYDGPPATAEMPYRQHEPPTTAGKVPSDIPPFEDLHHCEGAATMQQAEADMNVVQHAMIDPGIHAQWPMPSEAHMPAQQRRSVPLQHLQHEQQQLHPSYAWSTQQLTAIAATAATAAAAAFQQEINAQQTALAVATDSVKSAEQMQIRLGALQNPEVRQGMQAAAQFVDAQTTTDTANLGSSRESKQVAGISLAPAPLADMGRDLRQSEQPKKQQAVPKQSVALHKLKHRSSASRGLAGQARFISQAKDQAAPAKSPTGSIERSDKLAPDDHQRMHSRMQQPVLSMHVEESIARTEAGLRRTLEPLPFPQVAESTDDLHQQAARVVEARLGSAFSFAGMRAKLNELQASNPGIAERDVDFKAVVGKQARWRDEGAESLGAPPLHDFMAADETFSNVKALQEATAKDVQQRIATAHLRPVPSSAVLSRPLGIHPTPGNKRKFAAPAKAPFAELPISNVNAQPLQPGRQQVGKQIISEAQQQAVPASTRQKKKPRVAFGRRVGVTPPRKPQDGDPAVDSQQPKQASADASPDEPTQPQHTTMATGYSTSASRLEAIMQASRAIPEPVSSSYAPAASARPYGRQLQAVATQPVLQDTTHAAVGALHASGSPPACAHAAASLATGQARQVAGAQGRLNVAVTQQHTWQAPYNHAVYADEHSQHPPASDADACSVLHATTGMPRAATTPHACASAAAPDAGTGLPDVARRSDVGLQQQYDTLLTDLAAQQHSQLSTVPHSRLWDHQPPATTPMAAHGAQTVATSADVPCGAIQSVHLEAATGVASTSPVPVRRSAYPASQVVILPDDPFHQQLPQHLHELSQLPQRTFQPSAEPYQAQNASPPDPANLPMQDTSESCSASAQDVQVPAPQPSMAQQTQAHSQDQLAPEPESPGANAESPLPSPTASFALPGAACQDPAMRNPDASSCQVHHDSQGTSADARQPPDRKLLRASLADWLADAVASKLWSAFEKQRQASTPLGAQEPPGSGSCSLMVLPDVLLDRGMLDSLAHQAVSEELADLLPKSSGPSSSELAKQWQASVRASVQSIARQHSGNNSSGTGSPRSASIAAQPDSPAAPEDTTAIAQELSQGMAAVTANPGSPAVVLTPDDTGMSPLDDALLQLVLQTLTESSLEQIQEHQQRQQQGQQQRQLEAMDRQLTLQVQAQQSQQQAPSGLAESHTQQQTDVSASEASAAGREGLTQPVLNGSTAEQSLHQVDMSVSEAREAMLKNLAQNALTNLHHEQQQQQEQQQLLQQQEEVYEQQQCLLEQQSAVYDALLQQQQWELAQQQQQVYAEQQKLIEQQQSMLEALQQQQQLAVAAYQAGQEASKLDHNGAMCMKHGTGASDKAPCEQRRPDPHDTPDQSFSAQPPSQPTLSDPSSPPPMPAQRSAHDQPAQSPATLPAHAEAATQAAPHLPCSQPGEGLHINHSDTPHPQTAPGYPSAAASTAAARSAITGEQPPTSRTQLVSQHSDASSGHSNLQPSVPATSAALHSLLLQPWAQPGPLPQAYFLIPASEYQASGLLVLPATLLSPVPALPPAAYAPISAQHAIDAQLPAAVSQVHHEQQQQGTCSTDVLAKVGAGSVGGVGCEDSEASQVFTSASHQQPGADATLRTGLMQVMSGSNLQPVPWQSAARQAQDSPQAAQAVVDRFSDTPQLQALAQAEPQPPATNAWMERLLQELSLDDEDGGNASVENYLGASPQPLTQPPSASLGSVPSSHSQSDRQHTDNSRQQSQDSTAASLTGSDRLSTPPLGLSVGTAADPKPAAVMPEVLLTSGAALQLDAAQQKRPKPPLAVSEFKSDGAAAPHGMYGLNATMRLLQQIDLETAAHHADSSPLPGVDQASLANPQSSRGHDAAADMAAGTQSRLPGSAAPATAVDVTLSASCSDQMQVSAVRQDEGEEAQNLTDGGQQAGSHEQEAASFEQDSHQCPEDPRLAGEDDDSSTEGEESQDDSYADDSQGTGAEAWDEREQASHELKSKAMAGSDTHQECHEEHFPPYLWRQGQPLAPHTRPAAANSSSPSVSSLSSSGSREERQDDTLPSSLSGMARHFQAQRAAQADRRGHLPTKPSRCTRRGMLRQRAQASLHPPQEADARVCSQQVTASSSSCSSSHDTDDDSSEGSAVHSSAVTVNCDRVLWHRQSSSTVSSHAYAYRYASRAKKYAIQRRNIVAQAGIEDSLLCSTTTATAATGSTTVSLTETAGDSSVDTLQTDSLFASPALSALPET